MQPDVISAKSELLLLAILPCVFEHVLVISGDSSVFMFCNALPVHHANFTGVHAMYFLINVVTRTSLQTRLRDVSDFSSCSAVIFVPCKFDAKERSKHILRYFSKDVLDIWLLSIHSCPCLQLWSNLACHFRALLLLQNVSWQIVYMLFNLAEVVVVGLDML